MYKKKITSYKVTQRLQQLSERQWKYRVLQNILKTFQNWHYTNNYNFIISKYFANKGFRSRLRNHCSITGRSRSVYREFKMARHAVHKLGSSGLLIGIAKASW